jgi:hypothetical protein
MCDMRQRKLIGCLLILSLALPIKKVVRIYFGIEVTSKMLKQKAVSITTSSAVEPQEAQKQLIICSDAQERCGIAENYAFRYESVPQEISTPPPRA